MTINPQREAEFPQRRSIRLQGYDYSLQGFYFITFCTEYRKHLFGRIKSGRMILNVAGEMIKKLWREIPNDFDNIKLSEFVIMPNHFHGIIEITPVRVDSISARDNADSISANKYQICDI